MTNKTRCRAFFNAMTLLISFIYFACAPSWVQAEMQNLTLFKQELKRYHDSGEYFRDLTKVMQRATAYLQSRLAYPKSLGQHPAIVFDIDETALSNYHMMADANFCVSDTAFCDALQRADAIGIPSTLALYHFAKKHHVAVFFITARPEVLRKATIKNLMHEHYKHWDGLILKANQDKRSSVDFKTAERKRLIDQGYTILENIGDQKSDLNGGYADHTFQLPNPYYFLK